MKRKITGAVKWIVFICLVCLPLSCPAETETIRMTQGQSQLITTDFDVEVVVTGDPEVCRGARINTSSREVVINALKVGKTNIIIRSQDQLQRVEYSIEVSSSEAELIESELSDLVGGIDNVSVRKVGRKVVLEGEVLSQANLGRIGEIVRDMPNVINLVRLSPSVKAVIRDEIEQAIAEQGIEGVQVKIVKENYVLQGTVAGEGEAQLAMTIASSYSPNIVNAVTLDQTIYLESFSTIELHLSIIEIEKTALKDFGIHWNPLSSSEASGSFSKTKGEKSTSSHSVTGTITDLFPRMRRVFQNGRGRSLVEQSISAKTGEDADFFVGTEYPILVAQEGGTYTVQYKDIGVKLTMKPTLREDQYINIPVGIESTAIIGESAVGVPVLSSSRLHTVMNLVDNTSVAIAGLISRKELQAINDSAPSGSELSLFQLNDASSTDNDSREVVVFITPKIIYTYEEATQGLKSSIEEDFKQEELKALRKAYNGKKKKKKK